MILLSFIVASISPKQTCSALSTRRRHLSNHLDTYLRATVSFVTFFRFVAGLKPQEHEQADEH
jgi:hypothetical protein